MNDKVKGVFCILMAAFFFALMTLFIRLAGDVPSMQKSFFRNAVALIIAFFALKKSGIGFKWKKGNFPYLFMRAFFGTLGLICNFYAVDHLVLSDANMLNKLSPFFAIICSIFILKEKVKPYQWAAVIAAFIGALFIIKPTGVTVNFASIIGLIGGMGAGTAYTMVRKLSQRGEKGPFIVFFFSAFSCIVILPFVISDYHPMTLMQTLALIATGIAAAGGQFSITAAYSYAPAREISVFDYSQVLFAALMGFFFLGQVPDIWSILGYIIICSVSVIMFLKNKKEYEKQN